MVSNLHRQFLRGKAYPFRLPSATSPASLPYARSGWEHRFPLVSRRALPKYRPSRVNLKALELPQLCDVADYLTHSKALAAHRANGYPRIAGHQRSTPDPSEQADYKNTTRLEFVNNSGAWGAYSSIFFALQIVNSLHVWLLRHINSCHQLL